MRQNPRQCGVTGMKRVLLGGGRSQRAHGINTDAHQFRTLGFQIGKNNFSELVGAKMWLDSGWGSGDNSFKSSGSEFGGNGA